MQLFVSSRFIRTSTQLALREKTLFEGSLCRAVCPHNTKRNCRRFLDPQNRMLFRCVRECDKNRSSKVCPYTLEAQMNRNPGEEAFKQELVHVDRLNVSARAGRLMAVVQWRRKRTTVCVELELCEILYKYSVILVHKNVNNSISHRQCRQFQLRLRK